MLCRSEQKSRTWLPLYLLKQMRNIFMLGFVFFVSLDEVGSYFADLSECWLIVHEHLSTYLIQDQRPVSIVNRRALFVFCANFDGPMQGRLS
jgi:hypothetical protein